MTTQLELPGEVKIKLQDTKFMSAEEKRKVLRQWRLFLKSGLSRDKFTKVLYNHLIMHCSFIAHYDRQGFYSTYFEEGEDIVCFLSQFDNRNGIPKSVEYGMTCWYTDPDYNDINSEMCRIASKYIPHLVISADNKQREMDVMRAEMLLAKHGMKATIERGEEGVGGCLGRMD